MACVADVIYSSSLLRAPPVLLEKETTGSACCLIIIHGTQIYLNILLLLVQLAVRQKNIFYNVCPINWNNLKKSANQFLTWT